MTPSACLVTLLESKSMMLTIRVKITQLHVYLLLLLTVVVAMTI